LLEGIHDEKGAVEILSWNDKATGDKRSKTVIIADSIGLGLMSIETYERRQAKSEGDLVGASKAKAAPAPRKAAPSQEEPF
jgi:C4-type Zn-finger protein